MPPPPLDPDLVSNASTLSLFGTILPTYTTIFLYSRYSVTNASTLTLSGALYSTTILYSTPFSASLYLHYFSLVIRSTTHPRCTRCAARRPLCPAQRRVLLQLVESGAWPLCGDTSPRPTTAFSEAWRATALLGARLWQVGRLVRLHHARPQPPSTRRFPARSTRRSPHKLT